MNEPLSYAYESYVSGIWPPGFKNEYAKSFRAIRNQLIGHAAAYKAIHEIDNSFQVSYALHWRSFMPKNANNPLDRFVSNCRNKMFNHLFPLAVQSGHLYCPFPFSLFKELTNLSGPIADLKDSADFLGINYYTREICEFSPSAPFIPLGIRSTVNVLPVNALGWESCPAALLKLLTVDAFPYRKKFKR